MAAIQAITHFKWASSIHIPSHAGIKGNEIADQLANSRRNADDGKTMTHTPNTAEILTKIKNNHDKMVFEKTKRNSTNVAVTNRIRMGIYSWHTHTNRAIQSALLRLRSGHNKLNGTISK